MYDPLVTNCQFSKLVVSYLHQYMIFCPQEHEDIFLCYFLEVTPFIFAFIYDPSRTDFWVCCKVEVSRQLINPVPFFELKKSFSLLYFYHYYIIVTIIIIVMTIINIYLKACLLH